MDQREKLIEILQLAPHKYMGQEELADYLLANGVIVPPCKVGQIVYLFNPVRKVIYEAVVYKIGLTQKSNFIVTRDLYFDRKQAVIFEQIGKTLFLSREEAEAALKGANDEQRKAD